MAVNQIKTPILAPSLLAGDHSMLASSAGQIVEAGLSWAHMDVMDGHFVPNLTFGPQILADIRKHVPELFYDVHLMLDNPELFVEAFVNAGAGLISIHAEIRSDIASLLDEIHAKGAKSGLVVKPATDVECLIPLLNKADLVLVMTVEPGCGGQPFQPEMLPKIERLNSLRASMNANFLIEVDGGIDLESAPRCIAAGANVLVAGTSFFKTCNKSSFARKILAC